MRPRPPSFAGFSLLDAKPVATLDLHGFTAPEAELAVRNFVQTWRKRSPSSVVHIITGKGRGSGGRPVLLGVVKRMLSGELAASVLEFDLDLDEGGYLVRVR